MASADWKREAVQHLIETYRKHPVLYNMRHPRYYNKTTRSEALNMVLEEMLNVRPETTTQDVLRKIQTLRTQFGQEIAKARRGSKAGTPYKPTAWWYKGLSFLQHHIKHRSMSPTPVDSDGSWKQEIDDNSFNVSIVHKAEGDGEISNDYEHSMDETEYDTEIHYEIDPIDSRNIKTVEIKAVPPATPFSKQTNINDRKRQRVSATGFQEEFTSSVETPTGTIMELSTLKDQPPVGGTVVNNLIVPKERYISIGNFVGSQMAHLEDDYIFFETQMELLNVINRGILRQLKIGKSSPEAADTNSSRQATKRSFE